MSNVTACKQRIEALRQSALSPLGDKRAKVEQGLLEVETLEPEQNNSIDFSAGLQDEIDHVLSRTAEDLPDKLCAIDNAQNEINTFKTELGIERDPTMPNVLFNFLFFAALTGCESILNASFFATAHLTGSPVDALTLAGLIAFTNVTVSATFGFFVLRYSSYGKNAIDPSDYGLNRSLAKVGLTLFVIIAALFHLEIGLVRSQESLVVTHSVDSYLAIFNVPEAIFLILTGSCLSLLSFVKARTAFSDPIPGYSALYRALEQAVEDKEDLREEATEQIEVLIEDCLDEFESRKKADDKAREAYNSAVLDVKALISDLENHLYQSQTRLYQNAQTLVSKFKLTPDEIADLNLEIVCRFDSLLSVDVPQAFPPPKEAKLPNTLRITKAKAVKALDALFASNKEETL
ncbi:MULTISPECIES: hypothetical protein [Pseudoalteromonas]|uniref:Uncharacterized protein n=1 Tax=Pseudoalteromonas amylolytica TaxID=1859457 RepID=A0A1S1MTL5_9GAMM|nr:MULTISPECIES: hypothetical protein [Pseudoalteromonas]OHU89199.1 hypothetical protein BFC16_06060 [Pseudoalteromonas sp. JW3]OHU92099.1 hypothetical protein BET10_07165 [Pseudoalteromonas amylolytica]